MTHPLAVARRSRGRWTTLCRLGFAVVCFLIALTSSAQPAPDPTGASPAPVQSGARDADEALAEGGDDAAESEAAGRLGSPSVERLLFNAAERTRAGRDALDGDDVDRAVERFDTALRLEPGDPVARYNAGTARLADQRPGARELLEAAAQDAPASLKAPVSYNLGNARLDAGDFQGAIAAYEDALRADPGFADAKHNLEVALRRLQEQQQNQQQDPNQQQDQQDPQEQQDPSQQGQEGQYQDEQNQDEQNQDEQDQEGQDQNREESESGDPGEQGESEEESQDNSQGEQEPREQDPEDESGESDETDEAGGAGQGGQESPLPQFQDLPDMTAEEAAAILEAIENMERQDRREQALEAARRAAASGKKDW